ncbi:glycine-rich domain-containing protein [Lonsdalea quercina]|uniref:glycine-rich domain-containing protein n=1 Tax=Lonsdalea quercina TaxID=71657 RepID=UPI0039759E47
MAELTEKAEWTDGIYQLETSDPVVGGPGGISNRQAQELAYRTRYLKDNLDATSAGLAQHEAAADPHTQYAPKLNPTFSGMPKAPTPASDSNSDQLATTAFVKSVVAALVDGSPAALDTLKELSVALGNDPHFATTITNSIAQKAPLNSPALSGIPTAPTAEQSVNTTQIATTAFVKSAINALVDGSPAALDTLKELSAALGNDANFAATVTNSLSGKMEKSQNGADIPDKTRFLENLGLSDSIGYQGRLLNIQHFLSSGTYTKTPGTKKIKVILTGGGASGGKSSGTSSYARSGGAGGTRIAWIDVSNINGGVTVTIGAGGTSVTTAGSVGSMGGDSSLSTLMTAKGGTTNFGKGGESEGEGFGISGGNGNSGGSQSNNTIGGTSYWGGGGAGYDQQNISTLDARAYGSGGAGVSSLVAASGTGADGICVIEEYA